MVARFLFNCWEIEEAGDETQQRPRHRWQNRQRVQWGWGDGAWSPPCGEGVQTGFITRVVVHWLVYYRDQERTLSCWVSSGDLSMLLVLLSTYLLPGGYNKCDCGTDSTEYLVGEEVWPQLILWWAADCCSCGCYTIAHDRGFCVQVGWCIEDRVWSQEW